MTTEDTPHSSTSYAEDVLPRRAREVLTRGSTRSTVFVAPAPPYAVSGEGCYLTDQLGHRVIDANNNYTSLIHGHGFTPVADEVARLARTGTAYGLPTDTEISLAELLSDRIGLPHWRFSNSGTEAVMTAIRAARAFTGRDVIVRFEGSYHGTSDAVVDRRARGIPPGVRADVIELPQGDWEAFEQAIRTHGPWVAAVLIDLMPNRAGLVPADPHFVARLAATTRAAGALLIVDEVITLRLAIGGLAASYDVAPDLVTAAKIIGGGFPVGAVGGRSEILGVFDPLGAQPVGWGGTFSANPMSMTAGRIALQEYDAAAIARLNALGDELRESLTGQGISVNGRGSLLRLRESASADELWWAIYERGVLAGTNGLLALSTPMTEDDVAEIERAVIDAVRAVAR